MENLSFNAILGLELWETIVGFVSIFGFILIIGTLIYIFKKNGLIAKGIFKTTKKSMFSFISIMILFATTMAVASGSMIAQEKNDQIVSDVMQDNHIGLANANGEMVFFNHDRMEYFDSKYDSTETWKYDSKDTWNNNPEIDSQSFEEWASLLPSTDPITGHNSNVYLKDNTLTTDVNDFALQTYMLNQFWQQDWLSIGYNNTFTLNYTFVGLPNNPKKTEAKIIKYNPKTKDSILNKPARYNGEEYWINDLQIGEARPDLDKENPILKNGEALVLPKFMSENNFDIGDEIKIKPLGTTSEIQNITIAGEAIMPSQIFNVGKFGTEVLHASSSTVIVNEETFNKMLLESAKATLYRPINDFGDINSFQDLKTAGLNLEVEIGFGHLYHDLDNGEDNIIDRYNDYSKDREDFLEDAIENNLNEVTNNFASYNAVYMDTFSLNETNNIPPLDISPQGDFGFQSFWNNALKQDNSSKIVFDTLLMQRTFNNIISIGIFGVNFIVIIIFLRRKVLEDSKDVTQLKALGYSTKSIAFSYLLIPLTIIGIGGLIGLANGIWVQAYWVNFTMSGFSLVSQGLLFSYPTFVSIFLAPLILMMLLIFLIVNRILKRNVIESLNETNANKPNIVVRNIDPITNRMSFLSSYKLKNIFRSFGKSAFVFITILGISITTFTAVSMQTWVGHSVSLGEDNFPMESANWYLKNEMAPKEFLSEEEIAAMIETQEPYEFAQSPGEAIAESLKIIKSHHPFELIPGSVAVEPTTDEAEVIYHTWRKNVVFYMEKQTLNDKFLTLGVDLNNSDFDKPKYIIQGGIILGIYTTLKEKVDNEDGEALKQIEACKFETDIANEKVEEFVCYVKKSFEWKDTNDPLISNDIKVESKKHSDAIVTIIGMLASDIIMSPTGGYFPALIYTVIVKATISEIDNGSGQNFGDTPVKGALANPKTYTTVTLESISKKMLEMFIFQILPILAGEESSYIVPGVTSFNEATDDKLYLGIGPLGSFKGGTRINLLTSKYDGSNFFNPIASAGVEDYYKVAEENDQYLNSIVQSKGSLSNPSFVTSMEEAGIHNPNLAGKDQIGDRWIQTFPIDLLDYDKEISNTSSTKEKTWNEVIIPTEHESNEQYILDAFQIIDGIWQIPVNASKSDFGIAVEVIQRYSLYTIFSTFTYRGDAMNVFLKEDMYNIKATGQKNQPKFEKYQTFWNPEWEYNYEDTDKNEWKMLDKKSDTDQMQGINYFASAVPIPVSISTITNIVESQYEPFSQLITFFIISMFAMSFLIILIFTKEIIDGTKKETSVLKALGYQNYTASSLVIDPQGMLMMFSFLASIPLSMLMLNYLSITLSASTGMVFMLTWQGITSWLILIGIFCIFTIIFILGYLSFKRLSPLYAMNN